MPLIELKTVINARQDLVFNLARSVDFHKISMRHTKEMPVAGKTSGLMVLGDSVTWRGRYFGIFHKTTSRISEFDQPNYFVDQLVSGPFKSMKHEHVFITFKGQTIMTDFFYYQAPLGILGKIANVLFLEWYVTRILNKRNAILKEYAESDDIKNISS